MSSFSLSCSINWLAIFCGSGLLNKKCSFCRACSTHERLMEFSRCSLSANSIDVHQEMGSQLMISGRVYCVKATKHIMTISQNLKEGTMPVNKSISSFCLTLLPHFLQCISHIWVGLAPRGAGCGISKIFFST